VPRAVPYPCTWLAVPDRAWCPDGEPLTPAEAMTLAVFVDRWRRAEGRDGNALVILSTEDLAKASGLSVRGAETARGSLLERKLITRVHEGGGRGRVATYRLGAWRKPAPDTPHTNPAADAWLDEKPAPNPAGNPAAFPAPDVGKGPFSPLSEDQRERSEREEPRSISRELLREALLGTFGRMWCLATGSPRWPPVASDELVGYVLDVIHGTPDPLGLLERGLQRYFAHCAKACERPEFGWTLARDFGRWCGGPRPLRPLRELGPDEHELAKRRTIERSSPDRPLEHTNVEEADADLEALKAEGLG
jgi:hypothetical protein